MGYTRERRGKSVVDWIRPVRVEEIGCAQACGGESGATKGVLIRVAKRFAL